MVTLLFSALQSSGTILGLPGAEIKETILIVALFFFPFSLNASFVESALIKILISQDE